MNENIKELLERIKKTYSMGDEAYHLATQALKLLDQPCENKAIKYLETILRWDKEGPPINDCVRDYVKAAHTFLTDQPCEQPTECETIEEFIDEIKEHTEPAETSKFTKEARLAACDKAPKQRATLSSLSKIIIEACDLVDSQQQRIEELEKMLKAWEVHDDKCMISRFSALGCTCDLGKILKGGG